MDPLLTFSATRLARMIRRGQLRSVEVVEAHVEHLERVNPRLNAVVVQRLDAAREEAAAADRRLAAEGPDSLPPFHGVPCTVKESFAFRGLPHTSGVYARRGHVAEQNATAVARLRAAGAIPLGLTNVPELCLWVESNNPIYGRTNNPYNPRRTVGGSSGGEGAIVGAGASPFGLGSDVGGSIRLPAFFNGVFGHKPSAGVVPCTGVFPGELESRYLAVGPLARRAEDLMPLLRVLAGPDGRDPHCAPVELRDPGAVDLAGLRVYTIEENGATPVSAELRAAQRRAARRLAECGAAVVSCQLDKLRHSSAVFLAMLHEAKEICVAELLTGGAELHPGRLFLRWALRRAPHTLPALVLATFEDLPARLRGRSARFLSLGRELRQEYDEMLEGDAVLLYPSFARTAPLHYAPLLHPFCWEYTAILNVLQAPATAVPLGLDSRGLPLGLQVAARRGQDHLCIAVALELERAFGGWVPPARLVSAAPRVESTPS